MDTAKELIVMAVMVLVLPMSFLFFPWLGYMFGVHGIGLNSLITTCSFVFMWLLVLLVAIKLKSKALLKMYNYYWLMVTIVCCFAFSVLNLGILATFGFFLFVFFLTPIIGVSYLITDTQTVSDVAIIFLALFLFIIGFFAKKKVLNSE